MTRCCLCLTTSAVCARSSSLFASALVFLLDDANEADGTVAGAFDDDNCDDFNLEPEPMRRLTMLPWLFTPAFGVAFLRRMGLLGFTASEPLDVITRLWVARGTILPFLLCPL